MADPVAALERLVQVMHRLRSPGGCPWDREQTHESLRPYLIEEAYEVLEAIEIGDDRELCEELGDVLLQVVFHAELARERGAFDIDDVARAIVDKLVRRHPHVFADVEVTDANDVARNWARIKAEERQEKSGTRPANKPALSAIDGIPRALPALLRAHRIGEKAGRVGVDWPTAEAVTGKISEEIEEVRASRDHEERGRELGDLLLAVASYARLHGHDPETVLHEAIERFDARFRAMEAEAHTRQTALDAISEEEREAAWQRAKQSTAGA
jgi:tetrapyrrole methylase family protein/MazG family protein